MVNFDFHLVNVVSICFQIETSFKAFPPSPRSEIVGKEEAKIKKKLVIFASEILKEKFLRRAREMVPTETVVDLKCFLHPPVQFDDWIEPTIIIFFFFFH